MTILVCRGTEDTTTRLWREINYLLWIVEQVGVAPEKKENPTGNIKS